MTMLKTEAQQNEAVNLLATAHNKIRSQRADIFHALAKAKAEVARLEREEELLKKSDEQIHKFLTDLLIAAAAK